jgi:hypothetical protein
MESKDEENRKLPALQSLQKHFGKTQRSFQKSKLQSQKM